MYFINISKTKNVEKIYCIELVEEAVTMCQPIVKHEILKEIIIK